APRPPHREAAHPPRRSRAGAPPGVSGAGPGGARLRAVAPPGRRPRGRRREGDMDRLRDLAKDFRVACRALARRPVFLLLAGLTLATAIGGNTALFSVVDGVL